MILQVQFADAARDERRKTRKGKLFVLITERGFVFR